MLISIPVSVLDRCPLKEGQLVDFNTPFLEKKVEEEINISVAKNLDVSPQKIFHYLKKFVGESIEKNEIIAINKGMFTTKKIVSKYSGLIKEINHSDGSITILSKAKIENTINSFFKGKVDKINKNEISIEVNEGEQLPAKNVSHNFGGKTFYSDNNSDFLSENVFNSIIVCENITSYLKAKAEALGCQGFLSLSKLTEESGIPCAQFKNINDYKKIIKLKFPYCTIVNTSSIIYFYQ
ncbi:MAG: hypothetical protein UR54_C0001G0006 [Candidatus Roizmanbacteria bacterium GW2011_GWA2_34_18]|uniref:Uncharacterized protein n=1 Tax=Candidatus Roizmanbacteria bacterium GW2011_GWA2_34_18 TaxID=1618477 RepID=A0A0G0BCY2_9BACT|nr:MAG: hypothetical protein UR54_C0001G0006 [Candidatus Roizmanbacteria bacterium GW2011_GWA2_34_18]